MTYESKVRDHYASDDIADRILRALEAEGVAMDALTPLELAPMDQFHSRGLDATKDLSASLAPGASDHVVDIGCGLGGPARYLAYTHGCEVTGIDLTPDFCAAAVRLTEVTGLADRVRIDCGSALDLPYEDETFDAAYSQNVIMNIEDKAGFYREARRVLKPHARLALTFHCQGPGGEPIYPVPWAATAETGFLSTPEEARAEIEAGGFEIVSYREASDAQRAYNAAARERARREGPPALGFHVFLGEAITERQRNRARNVEEGRMIGLDLLCRKI